MRFLVDEDLPRSLVQALRETASEAHHVLELLPPGRPDDEVLALALNKELSLVTGDLGFGNILRYPLGTHRGIVVARFPNEIPNEVLNAAILAALRGLTEQDLNGSLVIIEPGRVRLRRKD